MIWLIGLMHDPVLYMGAIDSIWLSSLLLFLAFQDVIGMDASLDLIIHRCHLSVAMLTCDSSEDVLIVLVFFETIFTKMLPRYSQHVIAAEDIVVIGELAWLVFCMRL
jgi:hypothetical protein